MSFIQTSPKGLNRNIFRGNKIRIVNLVGIFTSRFCNVIIPVE
jgi:hypothetical protein